MITRTGLLLWSIGSVLVTVSSLTMPLAAGTVVARFGPGLMGLALGVAGLVLCLLLLLARWVDQSTSQSDWPVIVGLMANLGYAFVQAGTAADQGRSTWIYALVGAHALGLILVFWLGDYPADA